MENTAWQKYLLFFAAWFFVGLTVGSIAGLGAAAEQEICTEQSAARGILFAVLSNLPFWCCIFMPCQALHRFIAFSAAIAVKGALIGCTSVYIFSATKNPTSDYICAVLPQLLVTVPVLLAASSVKIRDTEYPYTALSAGINFMLSALAAVLTACVQFGIFFVFSQFA